MRVASFIQYVTGLLLAVSLAGAAQAETWKVDPDHSAAHFSIQHLMLTQVRGMFPDLQGTVSFENGKPTAFDFSINVESINTGVAKRDAHLRSADFFEVQTYPVMTFKSTKVVQVAGGYEATGTLTIKGVPRAISVRFSGLDEARVDPWKQTRRGGTAAFTVDRRNFNMNWNAPMDGGGVLIGNDVAVTVDIEAVQPD